MIIYLKFVRTIGINLTLKKLEGELKLIKFLGHRIYNFTIFHKSLCI